MYIIQCGDGSLYTGIAVDVQRRFQQHLAGKGAKFFRAKSQQALVFEETGHKRASASRRELFIKSLTRKQKLALIAKYR